MSPSCCVINAISATSSSTSQESEGLAFALKRSVKKATNAIRSPAMHAASPNEKWSLGTWTFWSNLLEAKLVLSGLERNLVSANSSSSCSFSWSKGLMCYRMWGSVSSGVCSVMSGVGVFVSMSKWVSLISALETVVATALITIRLLRIISLCFLYNWSTNFFLN